MREVMSVIKLIDEDTVELKFSRSSLCEHCASKETCNLLESSKTLIIKASKPKELNLEIGDIVIVEHKDFSVSKLSLLVYGIPLIVFISLMTIFTIVFENEFYGFAIGITALTGSFLSLRIYDKRFAKKYRPRVVGKYDENLAGSKVRNDGTDE